MEVSHFAQLRNDPAFVYNFLIALQLFRREISRNQCLVDHFSREHTALDRRVNSLQALRIEKTGRVAHQQHAIGIHPRHGEVTAGGDRLRTVANHLAALEQPRDVRMSLEALELRVRIDQRILIVESRNVSDVEHAILHAVDPATAVSRRIGRKAERVCDSAGWITIVRQLPQLFYAKAVDLRLTSFIEPKTLDKL